MNPAVEKWDVVLWSEGVIVVNDTGRCSCPALYILMAFGNSCNATNKNTMYIADVLKSFIVKRAYNNKHKLKEKKHFVQQSSRVAEHQRKIKTKQNNKVGKMHNRILRWRVKKNPTNHTVKLQIVSSIKYNNKTRCLRCVYATSAAWCAWEVLEVIRNRGCVLLQTQARARVRTAVVYIVPLPCGSRGSDRLRHYRTHPTSPMEATLPSLFGDIENEKDASMDWEQGAIETRCLNCIGVKLQPAV